MKKFILLFATIFSGISIYAQDSSANPTFLMRPYVENGIDFIRNDQIKQNYKTQSKYFLGAGLQIGFPEISKIIPYTQFSFSKFETEKSIVPNSYSDSALITKQILGGLIIPLKKIDVIYVSAKLAYSYSIITESFYKINSNSNGLQIGLSAQKFLVGKSRVYFDISYNFQKTATLEFRDFDMTKFAFGFIL